MIRPYLSDMINDHKTQKIWKVHSGNKIIDYKTTLEEWKIQLTMSINFISSKDDSNETRSETDEIIEELFKSLLQKYQERLEESMKRSVYF